MNSRVSLSGNMELAVKIGILSAKVNQNLSEIIELMQECEKGSCPRLALRQAGWAAMNVTCRLRLAGDWLATENCSKKGVLNEKS